VGWVILRASGVARADHGMMMSGTDHATSEITAGLAVEAAGYSNALYVGTYQGVTPSLGWMYGRFGTTAAISLYHVDENGRSVRGLGDAMLGAHAIVVATDSLEVGAGLHLMLPTGSEPDNLGMGHAMAIPSAWLAWRARPLTVTASAGYGRALVALGGTQHVHGAGPLVDPMNLQELTWSAGAEVDVGHGVQLGARTSGAAPLGAGQLRAICGGRVAWATPRVTTGFELSAGVAGDPFTVRGVVETTLRF